MRTELGKGCSGVRGKKNVHLETLRDGGIGELVAG